MTAPHPTALGEALADCDAYAQAMDRWLTAGLTDEQVAEAHAIRLSFGRHELMGWQAFKTYVREHRDPDLQKWHEDEVVRALQQIGVTTAIIEKLRSAA